MGRLTGKLKPGTLKENINLDEAFEMWEGLRTQHDGAAAGQLWQVPMPPEDIPSWLNRIGLLQETPDEDVESLADSSLLDDEFDLDDEDSTEGAAAGQRHRVVAGAGRDDERLHVRSQFSFISAL